MADFHPSCGFNHDFFIGVHRGNSGFTNGKVQFYLLGFGDRLIGHSACHE
jgi:hypothetical protein